MIIHQVDRLKYMNTFSYDVFHQQSAQLLNSLNDDHNPIQVTCQNGQSVVMMSLNDFQSYQETAYLMASPQNALHLNQAIAQIEAGLANRHELIEL